MKTFKRHVLPVMFALIIIALCGGAMFVAMRFGFNFQNQVVAHDLPSSGTLYSAKDKQDLTDTVFWSTFKSADKKKFVNDMPEDSVADDDMKILGNVKADAVTLARFFLGRMTTYSKEISVDLSEASYAIKDIEYIIEATDEATNDDGTKQNPHVIFIDNCIVSFDTVKEKYVLRYAYNRSSELMFFEIESLSDQECTANEVNSAYQNLLTESKNLYEGNDQSSYRFTADTLLYNPNIIWYIENQFAGDDVIDEYSSLMKFESYRFDYPISYFLAMYSWLGNNREEQPETTKKTLSVCINFYPPDVKYSDGYIYINMGSVDGPSGIRLKYSVSDRCITGMCVGW